MRHRLSNRGSLRTALVGAAALGVVAAGSAVAATDSTAPTASTPSSTSPTAGPIDFSPHGMSTDRFPNSFSTDPSIPTPCPDADPQEDVPAGKCTRVTVPGSGGTPITVRIFRPDTSSDPGWRTPVILDDGPYFESTYMEARANQTQNDLGQYLINRYPSRGYTVALMNMRGTGRSGGCFDYWGQDSARDFAAVVNYLAALPWTNHKVGSWGGSADGIVQVASLAGAPKALATAVVANTVSSMYDVSGFDGVPYDGGASSNASGEYGVGSLGADAKSGASPTDVGQEIVARSGTCWANSGSDGFHWQDKVIDGTHETSQDGYNASRDWRPSVQNVKASVLFWAGLQDRNTLPIAADGWYDQLPTFKRAVFSQYPHLPCFLQGKDLPTGYEKWLDYGRTDCFDMYDAWFDYWLLGLPTGVDNWPDVQVQDEHSVWRAVPSYGEFGISRSMPLGEATLEPATAEQADQQCALTLGAGTGGAMQTLPEAEQLCWQTPALGTPGAPQAGPWHLSGQPHLLLPATLDLSDARFMVALQEVKADGTVRDLTRGYLAASWGACGGCPGSHPDASFVPSGQHTYEIRMLPFDVWLGAGSSLRLVVSGVDPNAPATNEPVGVDEAQDYRAMPEDNGWVATIPADGSAYLQLPTADDSCGVIVASTEPLITPTPGCVDPRRVGVHRGVG